MSGTVLLLVSGKVIGRYLPHRFADDEDDIRNAGSDSSRVKSVFYVAASVGLEKGLKRT
jgi:hypothetical protein